VTNENISLVMLSQQFSALEKQLNSTSSYDVIGHCSPWRDLQSPCTY